MSNKSKKVGEIFSDYQTNSNIKYASINGLNVIKKTNTLEVILYFDEYIEIKEIWYFEKFLKERFSFEHIDIKINYHEQVEKKNIQEEWRNIIAYMAHKYPLAKPMLLLNADVVVEGKTITVKMHIKGCDFLNAKKTDKELEKVLKNLFGVDYQIDLVEEISREDMKAIQKNLEQEEAQIIARIEEENRRNQIEKEQEVPEYHDNDYIPPTDMEGYIPPEEGEFAGVPEEEIMQEEKEYIMGKPSKAKEKLVKVKDLTANDGRVTLEGRILSSSARETKSGKGMIILELYDGTGTITCKSFAKDIKEGNEIVEKIQNAKAIKLIRKSRIRYLCRRCHSYL